MATCEEMLAEARSALHSLMTGTKEVSVRYGERSVNYNLQSATQLEQYIARLESECGENAKPRKPFGVCW